MEAFGEVLQPWYFQLKFLHVISVAMWSFSTAVAYRDYIVPVFNAWSRAPADSERIARRDWAMERFDSGAILEHVAFPLLLVTGLAMFFAGGWSLDGFTWLAVKLVIVAAIFIPMEAVDYYISHFGGNKARLRNRGDMARHEAMIRFHWLFFKVSTPLVVIFIPAIYYLAIVKPF